MEIAEAKTVKAIAETMTPEVLKEILDELEEIASNRNNDALDLRQATKDILEDVMNEMFDGQENPEEFAGGLAYSVGNLEEILDKNKFPEDAKVLTKVHQLLEDIEYDLDGDDDDEEE